jgi:hypothetical protein
VVKVHTVHPTTFAVDMPHVHHSPPGRLRLAPPGRLRLATK